MDPREGGWKYSGVVGIEFEGILDQGEGTIYTKTGICVTGINELSFRFCDYQGTYDMHFKLILN